VLDPGAARSASLRACPFWLPSAAPPAPRETLNRSIKLGTTGRHYQNIGLKSPFRLESLLS
jgi:hypothetical protein